MFYPHDWHYRGVTQSTSGRRPYTARLQLYLVDSWVARLLRNETFGYLDEIIPSGNLT